MRNGKRLPPPAARPHPPCFFFLSLRLSSSSSLHIDQRSTALLDDDSPTCWIDRIHCRRVEGLGRYLYGSTAFHSPRPKWHSLNTCRHLISANYPGCHFPWWARPRMCPPPPPPPPSPALPVDGGRALKVCTAWWLHGGEINVFIRGDLPRLLNDWTDTHSVMTAGR